MKKGKRSINLIAVLIAVLTISFYCVSAIAEDLRVGVYSGIGQKGILEGLKNTEGIKAEPLKNFSPLSLTACDVVVWPHGRVATGDRARLWRVLLTEYVKAGGGLILTHDAAGGAGKKRGDMGEAPLFGDIARSPGYPARKDKLILKKAPDTVHSLAKALPNELTHAYYDHMALIKGSHGTTMMVDEDGDPVVIAGQFGKGRVVIMGNLPGYKGIKKQDKSVSEEGEFPLSGGELALIVESLKWAGETFQKKPILPIELETTLDAAEASALKAGAVRKEPIAVFFDIIPTNSLDREKWINKVEPGKSGKRGYWFGHGLIGPPYNMVCESSGRKANEPLTSRKFEKSPVTGRFVVSFDAVLNSMFHGILDISLVNDEGSGYGAEIVYIGADDKMNTEVATPTSSSKPRRVKISWARNGIFRVDKGTKKLLAVMTKDKYRLRGIRKGEERVPVRLERSDEGVLTLSISGLVVASVKDTAYDNFTKLVANMPLPGGRLAFDNPKVTGYFADTGVQKFAARPWIVPEPKQIEKNKETFTLVNGAQFVVSDKEKINTYLLDEWIIPEIEGYYGVKMKAVTIDNVDKSKPVIYLGKSSNPAFRKVFDAKLRAISEKDPGPEGYAILVTKGKAHAAGATERGTFWALQSLVQLIERKDNKVYIRGVYVKDWPDFKLRGGLTYLTKPQFEPMIPAAHRMIRFMARLKFNAWPVGTMRTDFPSYNLAGYGCRWNFNQMIELYKYAQKYHIQVIPTVPSLSHSGWKVVTYLARSNPKLWQRMLDEKVLLDPLGNKFGDALNPLSPLAWDMVKATNEDVIKAFPEAKIVFASTQDEITPPLNTLMPDRSNEDLLVEWINKHHKLLKKHGVRMMMYCDYLLEYGKFPGSCATSGGKWYGGMISHGAIDRIPKDIILVDWYYGTLPSRSSYKYMRDKGFDVVAMPGSNYGYAHESVYYAAVEGKKAGLMGIIRHGHPLELYQNPRYAYTLPWIYGWTVPDKMIPDWNWQEDWEELYQGPLPSHLGKIESVDISSACNDSRVDEKADDGKGWLDYGKNADLRKLPAGELIYKRYRFTIVDETANNGKSIIITAAKKGGSKDDPARKASIPVNTKAKSLVFLHASSSMGGSMGWRKPGFYRVNYADGRGATVQLFYGHNIGPWIFSVEPGQRNNNFFKNGYLSWTRLAYESRTVMGDKTGVYSYEWVNPYPDKKIVSVDMEMDIDYDVRVALVALSVVK